MDDPTYEEMVKALKGEDDLDIEEAIYWFAADYHNGQASNLYAAIGKCQYKPGVTQNRPTGEARRLYERLELRYSDHEDMGLDPWDDPDWDSSPAISEWEPEDEFYDEDRPY